MLAEIDRTGTVDVKAFWIRRARRLLPALALLLAAMFAVGVATGQAGEVLRAVAVVALYAGNIIRALGGSVGVMDHTWSLSVEEQFYLVWPLAMLVLARRCAPVRFAKVMASATIVALLWRVTLVASGADQWAYFAPDANAYALLAGAFLAAVFRCGWAAPRWAGVVGLVGVLIAAVAPLLPELLVRQPIAALAGCLLVAGATCVPGLSLVPLTYLGRISYGIYLWHFPLMMVFRDDQIAARWVAATVSVLVAAASFHLLERRFLTRAARRTADVTEHGAAAGLVHWQQRLPLGAQILHQPQAAAGSRDGLFSNSSGIR